MQKKIVLAFSGGLDTSAIIPWLIETYNAEVIAYCSDLGNAPDYESLKKRALSLGARDFIFEDLKDRFVSDFVIPLVRSGAVYQEEYLLGTAIARPLIAERVAHWAYEQNADAVAHGATGKGNDQIRFERAWAFLIPNLEVIAPWKIWNMKGRRELIQFLESRGHFGSDEVAKQFSVDVNLLHRSCEGGVLEDIEKPFSEASVYNWVATPNKIVSTSEVLEIEFQNGFPVGLNGKKLKPEALLSRLNQAGGLHGIGVVDLVEERTNGVKSRGVYETPGGTILHKAYRALKQINWSREQYEVAISLSQKYAKLVYDGLWFSDARRSIEAYFTDATRPITGRVSLCLDRGQLLIKSRSSQNSLYGRGLVSFEEDPYKLNEASRGFSRTLCFSQWQAGKVKNGNPHD